MLRIGKCLETNVSNAFVYIYRETHLRAVAREAKHRTGPRTWLRSHHRRGHRTLIVEGLLRMIRISRSCSGNGSLSGARASAAWRRCRSRFPARRGSSLKGLGLLLL